MTITMTMTMTIVQGDMLGSCIYQTLFCFNRPASRRLFCCVFLVREDYDVGVVYHGVCKKFYQEVL